MLQTPTAEASPWQVSWEVLRFLSLMPPPQDLEQLAHVSHVDHSQSTEKKIRSMNDWTWHYVNFDLFRSKSA